jgi:hypothetical protein
MTRHPDETYARIDRMTARVVVPVHHEHVAGRVRLHITGRWHDPALDPTPARVEVRMMGGPHRGGGTERSAEERRMVVWRDTTVDLPEKVSGVAVEVQHRSPGMDLLVRLVPLMAN